MPPDRRAELVAAVRASPQDDRPLLVLADFLQERGEPLGELIEVSIARKADPSPELDWRERKLARAAFPGNIRWKLVNGRATAFGHAGLFRGTDREGARTWMRLYPDGTAVDSSVTTQGEDAEFPARIAAWLDPVGSGAAGSYTVDALAFLDGSPATIHVTITSTRYLDVPVVIDWKGTLDGERLTLRGSSSASEHRWKDVLEIVPCAADSREPEAK